MKLTLGKTLKGLTGPVMVSGHTGFKGAWLTLLLQQLGIEVVGYSLPPNQNSLYSTAKLKGTLPETFADIRDIEKLNNFFSLHKPSAVIHMAAQSLVIESYKSPVPTFDINVMGTVNILEQCRQSNTVVSTLIVTTDKVYKNNNNGSQFSEDDPLEGKDPYSSSKVAAESAANSWRFLEDIKNRTIINIARSGNVLGGGDLSDNRIIPDLVKSYTSKKNVEIRNPSSVRPWQHVLDPLSGYILQLEKSISLKQDLTLNFGPTDLGYSVQKLISIAEIEWPGFSAFTSLKSDKKKFLESNVLNLNSNLAQITLGWSPRWTQTEAIQRTVNWWKNNLITGTSERNLCLADIKDFLG